MHCFERIGFKNSKCLHESKKPKREIFQLREVFGALGAGIVLNLMVILTCSFRKHCFIDVSSPFNLIK